VICAGCNKPIVDGEDSVSVCDGPATHENARCMLAVSERQRASFKTIDDLRSQLGATMPSDADRAYAEKMLHPLPDAKTVDRRAFILERVTGKRVLEFGASGPMHEAIVKAASVVCGVDRESSDGVIGFDLDDVTQAGVPVRAEQAVEFHADIVICGEVIEHLSNPGWFLTRLRRQCPGVPVIITVPNAFSAVAAKWAAKGKVNVNGDHVAWYCPQTLRVLLERAGYAIREFYFYGGPGPTSEGLIVVTE
jgi:2-polyprenyl-3-methyl-5-hydroxy-6-metoxy-1,4-benzoquinol methylase